MLYGPMGSLVNPTDNKDSMVSRSVTTPKLTKASTDTVTITSSLNFEGVFCQKIDKICFKLVPVYAKNVLAYR